MRSTPSAGITQIRLGVNSVRAILSAWPPKLPRAYSIVCGINLVTRRAGVKLDCARLPRGFAARRVSEKTEQCSDRPSHGG